jgi:flagellar FliL protein
MAEDELDDMDMEAEPEEGGGRKGKRLILIVVLPILLVVGAAAGAYFTGAADPLLAMIFGEQSAEPEAPPEDEQVASVAKPNNNTFLELPELLVNLDGAGSRSQYLKIRVTLEMQNAEDQGKLDGVMPRIMDNFQIYLRELRVDDLRGSAGIYRLREELLARVNVATRPVGVEINDVLFREMLIQ